MECSTESGLEGLRSDVGGETKKKEHDSRSIRNTTVHSANNYHSSNKEDDHYETKQGNNTSS
jgi:hypothetical protein